MYVVYKNLFFQKEYGTQRTFAPFFCVKPDYVIKLTSYHERFFAFVEWNNAFSARQNCNNNQ